MKIVETYVGVDVDFRRRFTGQSDELSWIEGPYHHFSWFLHRSKSGGSGGIVAILHRFNLAEDFLRNTRTLQENKEISCLTNLLIALPKTSTVFENHAKSLILQHEKFK